MNVQVETSADSSGHQRPRDLEPLVGRQRRFWNWLSQYGFGTGDLLKVIASPRNRRFQTYGIFNQPGYMQPAQANEYACTRRAERAGSKFDIDKRMDIPTTASPAASWAAAVQEPEVRRLEVGRQQYGTIRTTTPKRPGASLPGGDGLLFCHVGPDPVNPPADPTEPADWATSPTTSASTT